MPSTTPTIGRKLWYWDRSKNLTDQPEDATVVFVHSDTCVNLRVTDHLGDSRPVHYCYLRQPDTNPPSDQPYCEWMPYQVQQHAKQKPTIQELETILSTPESTDRVVINPDGTIKTANQ